MADFLGILGLLLSFFNTIKNALRPSRKKQIKIFLSIEDSKPNPVFVVEIRNPSPTIPIVINKISVGFGCVEYNHFFLLQPYDVININPKRSAKFKLLYSDTRIGQTTIQKELTFTKRPPNFDSPADLFKAIAYGKAKDSWLEIDYNEIRRAMYYKGKIKNYFKEMIQMRKMMGKN